MANYHYQQSEAFVRGPYADRTYMHPNEQYGNDIVVVPQGAYQQHLNHSVPVSHHQGQYKGHNQGHHQGFHQEHFQGHQADEYISPASEVTEACSTTSSPHDLPAESGDTLLYSERRRKQVQRDIVTRTMEAASRLMERGKGVLDLGMATTTNGDSPQIHTPRPLSLMCFFGGVLLSFASTLGVINIFSILSRPVSYIMQAYLLAFGLTITVSEARMSNVYINTAKPILGEWVKILSFPLGKGLVYIFIGLTGLSLWDTALIQAVVGLYVCLMGILCVASYVTTMTNYRTSPLAHVPAVNMVRTETGDPEDRL